MVLGFEIDSLAIDYGRALEVVDVPEGRCLLDAIAGDFFIFATGFEDNTCAADVEVVEVFSVHG